MNSSWAAIHGSRQNWKFSGPTHWPGPQLAFRKHGVYLSVRDLEAPVSEPGGVLLGRAELERAFAALGDRLARRGIVADVFIVGDGRAASVPALRWASEYDLNRLGA